jgi:hypothetical protein
MDLALSIPPVPQAVCHARHRVRDWMAGAGWPARATNDVLLVISELVTNGIIHEGAKDTEVSVARDELGGASVEVVTADLPSGHTSPDVRVVSDPAERGRGACPRRRAERRSFDRGQGRPAPDRLPSVPALLRARGRARCRQALPPNGPSALFWANCGRRYLRYRNRTWGDAKAPVVGRRGVPSMRDDSEGIYGWCGLCHSFCQFPHDCSGQDLRAEDKDVDGVNSSSAAGFSWPSRTGAGQSR